MHTALEVFVQLLLTGAFDVAQIAHKHVTAHIQHNSHPHSDTDVMHMLTPTHTIACMAIGAEVNVR